MEPCTITPSTIEDGENSSKITSLFYHNLGEIPSFISSHRQQGLQIKLYHVSLTLSPQKYNRVGACTISCFKPHYCCVATAVMVVCIVRTYVAIFSGQSIWPWKNSLHPQ